MTDLTTWDYDKWEKNRNGGGTKEELWKTVHSFPSPLPLFHTLSAGRIHSKVISNPIGSPGSRWFSKGTANILRGKTSGRNSYQVPQHSIPSFLSLRQDKVSQVPIFNPNTRTREQKKAPILTNAPLHQPMETWTILSQIMHTHALLKRAHTKVKARGSCVISGPLVCNKHTAQSFYGW